VSSLIAVQLAARGSQATDKRGACACGAYVGTAAETSPAALPPIKRPKIRARVVGDHPISAPPSRNSTLDSTSVFCLPMPSHSLLQPMVPAIAPMVVEDAIRPVISGRACN
jgi:hypothetical protein